MTNHLRALTMACHYTESETTCWFSSGKLTSVLISSLLEQEDDVEGRAANESTAEGDNIEVDVDHQPDLECTKKLVQTTLKPFTSTALSQSTSSNGLEINASQP